MEYGLLKAQLITGMEIHSRVYMNFKVCRNACGNPLGSGIPDGSEIRAVEKYALRKNTLQHGSVTSK